MLLHSCSIELFIAVIYSHGAGAAAAKRDGSLKQMRPKSWSAGALGGEGGRACKEGKTAKRGENSKRGETAKREETA